MNLLRKKIFFVAVILIFLFFLSNLQIISVLCILALLLLWLIGGEFQKTFSVLKKSKILLLIIAYYLVHVVGLLYSSNISYGLFDLQVKLPFLVFPVLLSAYSFDEQELSGMKKAFILGCSVSALICLFSGGWHYYHTHEFESLFYIGMSRFLHPSYFAAYLNLALLLAMDELFKKRKEPLKLRGLLTTSLFINACTVMMLSSRTSIFVFFLTVVSFISIYTIEKKIVLKDWKLISTLTAVLALVLWFTLKEYDRFSQVEETISSSKIEIISPPAVADSALIINPHSQPVTSPVAENSTSIRLSVWKNSIELIHQHPLFGVGIGDIRDELKKVYQKNGFEYGVKNYMNPHNQYLHTTITLGIVGLGLLLLILFAPFVMAVRAKDWIYAFFIVIIMMNALTESILERQAGILFFAFFSTLFYNNLRNTKAIKIRIAS